jgi:hypothetical protein
MAVPVGIVRLGCPKSIAWHEASRRADVAADQRLAGSAGSATSASLCRRVAGTVRLFSVANAAGKAVATIGIVCEEHRRRSIGTRAACNRPVTGTLVGLDAKIARRYTEMWRLEPPTQARRPDVPEQATREDAEIDAAALRYLEERLEVMVDREDPMLRAMIAMERDFMETMPGRRTSRDGASS